MCFMVRDFDCVPEEGKLQRNREAGGARLARQHGALKSAAAVLDTSDDAGPSIRHHYRQHASRDMVSTRRHDNGLAHRRAGTNWNVSHLRRIRRQSAQSVTAA